MTPDDARPAAISVTELECLRDVGRPVVVVDVRTAAEFTEAHVDGARHVEGRALPRLADELRVAGLVVTTCANGGALSAVAAAELRSQGVDARFLSGGTRAWLSHTGRRPASAALDHAREVLHDAHPQCRIAGLELLATEGDAADRREVLGLFDDPSAEVRAALARVVGAGRWEAGVDVLVRLLDDRAITTDATAFVVARAAARALTAFESLPDPVARRIVAFLEAGEAGCPDIAVHYHLVAAIPSGHLRRAGPVLRRVLCDPWTMDGEHDAGTPLRYAVAWRFLQDVELARDLFDHELAWALSRHPDDRIAAPALVLLGVTAGEAALAVAAREPPDRAVLVHAGRCLASGRRPPGSQGAPTRVLAAAVTCTTEAAWTELLETDPEARAALAAEERTPLTRAFLWCLSRLTTGAVRPLLPPVPPRAGELARGHASGAPSERPEWN